MSENEVRTIIKRNGYWVADGKIKFNTNWMTKEDKDRIDVLDAHEFFKYIDRVGIKVSSGSDTKYDLCTRNYIDIKGFTVKMERGDDRGLITGGYNDLTQAPNIYFGIHHSVQTPISTLPDHIINKIAALDLTEEGVPLPGVGKKEYGVYHIKITKENLSQWAR